MTISNGTRPGKRGVFPAAASSAPRTGMTMMSGIPLFLGATLFVLGGAAGCSGGSSSGGPDGGGGAAGAAGAGGQGEGGAGGRGGTAGGAGGRGGGAGGSAGAACPDVPAPPGIVYSLPTFLGNCQNPGAACSGTSGGTDWCCLCKVPTGCTMPLWTCAYLVNISGICPATEPAAGTACTPSSTTPGCAYCPGGQLHPLSCTNGGGTSYTWTPNWPGQANCL
jgi:hypothetical protein